MSLERDYKNYYNINEEVDKMKGISLIKRFCSEEDGMGVIEIILIIVVLISLVLIFRNQLTSIVNSLLNKVRTNANSV